MTKWVAKQPLVLAFANGRDLVYNIYSGCSSGYYMLIVKWVYIYSSVG